MSTHNDILQTSDGDLNMKEATTIGCVKDLYKLNANIFCAQAVVINACYVIIKLIWVIESYRH